MTNTVELLPTGHSTLNIRTPKHPSTLNQWASECLREAIIAGELPPGTPLKDMEVARQLGLSATPVREALLQLSAEGLVEIQPNKLKRVMPIDHQAMVELIQVQNELWALGYLWGSKNITEQDFALLEVATAKQKSAILGGEIRNAVKAAYEFHHILAIASRNRELLRVSADRIPLMERYVVLCIPHVVNHSMIEQLETLYGALRHGNQEQLKTVVSHLCHVIVEAAVAARDAALNRDPQAT